MDCWTETALIDLSARILMCRYEYLTSWDMENLAAPYWRLYSNDRPGAQIELGGKRIALQPGRLMLIPPETPYSARLDRPVRHFYLHFTVRPRFAVPAMVHTFAADRPILEAIDEIDRLSLSARETVLRVSVLGQMLVHWSLARIPAVNLQESYPDARIDKAVQYLQDHLSDKVANPELARLAGMNTNAFIRLFRQTTGETPQSFFTRLRIEHACLQLHYSDKNIDRIAGETGFCDRYHFTRTFRKLRGMGPAAFRRLIHASGVPKTAKM